MPQIEISYPPPGKFNSQCPQLILKDDRYGNKTRRVGYIQTIKVRDLLDGEAELQGITAFTIRRTIPEQQRKGQRAGKEKETNDTLDSGVELEGPKPSAKRVRHFELRIHACV